MLLQKFSEKHGFSKAFKVVYFYICIRPLKLLIPTDALSRDIFLLGV